MIEVDGQAGLACKLLEAVGRARRWPQGLYVHVPYCPSKCPYCDFNSYALPNGGAGREMVEALLAEARGWARLAREARGGFRTVFVGGGTPTVLAASELGRLLEGLRALLPLDGVEEWTVEANPGTLTPGRIAAMRACGVNRVSLGAQSFEPRELKRLGRAHTVADIHRSLDALREAGFSNINLDLMFALPGQSLRDWERTLEQAIDAGAPHLSTYCLTLADKTPFYRLWRRGLLQMAPEELQARMYRRAVRRLAQAGLRRYEVSNFARPGAECRHNLNYWEAGEYLGIGPGAHSHWAGFRFSTLRSPARYVQAARSFAEAAKGARPSAAPTVAFVERPDREQQMDEHLMLALRLARGLHRVRFRERFGCWPEQAYDLRKWQELQELGLLCRRGSYWRLTARGFLVADAVVAALAAAGQAMRRPAGDKGTSQLPSHGEGDEEAGAQPALPRAV